MRPNECKKQGNCFSSQIPFSPFLHIQAERLSHVYPHKSCLHWALKLNKLLAETCFWVRISSPTSSGILEVFQADPPPVFSYWFQVWKETVSPMARTSGRKRDKESWTHHILIIVAIFFRHSCVWVTVPNGEFHRAAESTSNWGGKGKPLQVSSAVSSAWAFASPKGLRRK